jgi:hypothetical protein
MKRLLAMWVGVAATLSLLGCEPPEINGGGGGVTVTSFSKGFVFIRAAQTRATSSRPTRRTISRRSSSRTTATTSTLR